MSGFNSCTCPECPNGVAKQYQLSVEGYTNDMCTECTDLNDTYVLDHIGGGQGFCGVWQYDLPSSPCGASTWQLEISAGQDAQGNPTVYLEILLITPGGRWEYDGPGDCVNGPWTLTKTDDTPDCGNTPETVTVTAAPFSRVSITAEDWKCFLAMLKGCPPGTCEQCLNPPYVGGPVECCVPSDCDCEDREKCRCGQKVVPAKRFVLFSNCKCREISACQGGRPAKGQGGASCSSGKCNGGSSTSRTGNRQLDKHNDKIAAAQNKFIPKCPPSKSPWINPASGNLVLGLFLPEGGAYDPYVALTYNSQAPAASDFGFGWTSNFSQSVTQTSGVATVTNAEGTELRYTDTNASGVYVPMSGVRMAWKRWPAWAGRRRSPMASSWSTTPRAS